MTDATSKANYACDSCYQRKVTCSRTHPSCMRCSEDARSCVYSRTGSIPRPRKRKNPDDTPAALSTIYGAETLSAADEVQSHLATEIDATRGLLSGPGELQDNSLGALSSLSQACAAVWHSTSDFDRPGKGYFLFRDRAASWVDTFTTTLAKGHPILACAPDEGVLHNLRTCRPHLVQERAWLVMYYSIILSRVSSTTPEDVSTKEKLRCNLWLAVNDVRILLQPSEPNIQAVTLLATHVEEFTSPSLCWMLIANACRMLQALGINLRHLSPETRQRRTMTFWYLNLVDKGLSIIFGRPPTFHRAMSKDVPLPTVSQLLPFQPHNEVKAGASPRPGALFGAHYIQQIMKLSYIMGDIWSCLHEGDSPDPEAVESVKSNLESWYGEAKPLLEASILAEKALLDAKALTSVNLGLHTLEFNRHYLLVLLGRSAGKLEPETISHAKEMLYLLKHLVSDSEEVYNGIVWQLVCCPFTPFLALFGQILDNKGAVRRDNVEALAAMKELPVFLEAMGRRNTLASKLLMIADVFVEHAESVVNPPPPRSSNPTSHPLAAEYPPGTRFPIEGFPGSVLNVAWNSFLDHTTNPSPVYQFDWEGIDGGDSMPPGGAGNAVQWADMFLGEANIDWLALSDNLTSQ